MHSGRTGNYHYAVYDECTYSDTFWLEDRTRVFVQYTISLSSLCKLIWRHWTYKMPVIYILWSVWVRLSILSPLSIIQYVGLYVFSLPISLVMIEGIYIYFVIIKSEVWTITHCLGLGHETMVYAVCLSIFSYITFESQRNNNDLCGLIQSSKNIWSIFKWFYLISTGVCFWIRNCWQQNIRLQYIRQYYGSSRTRR